MKKPPRLQPLLRILAVLLVVVLAWMLRLRAAFLDGADAFTTFWRVTLPLALPSIGVAALIAFLIAYAEFAIGWLFIENGRLVTLAMAIWAIRQMGASEPWSELAALSLMMSIPVVVIFVILQRSLLERMMFGAIDE